MNKISVIIIGFLIQLSVFAQPNRLQYSFKLNELQNGIDVIMTYYNIQDDTLTFLVPSNYDNTTLKNSILVNNLELLSEGELVKLENSDDVEYRYKGTTKNISISYTIPNFADNSNYLPCQGDAYFAPAITKNFFHMYGDMSLVFPKHGNNKRTYFDLEIEWLNFPDTWHIANDFDIAELKNGKRKLQVHKSITIQDMGESLFFGGSYRKATFSTNTVNFHTFIYGDFQFSDQDFISQIELITNAQMQHWNHFNHSKDYVISITQKGVDCGKISGRNMYNSFSFYMSGNFTKAHIPIILQKGLTHEFAHSWIGTNLVKHNENWEEMRWFVEGFTEYYSGLINLKAGLFNKEQYLTFLNSKVIRYMQSPYAKTTLKESVAKYQFSDKFRTLAYDKGTVFAFYLDGYIRKQSNSTYNLKDIMMMLINTEKDNIDGNLDVKLMVSLIKSHFNIDMSQLIKTYIVEGNLIPIESPLIEESKLEEKIAFDYGFDFLTSIDKEVIVGLKADSNAYKQGLRNGQKLKAIKGITNNVNGDIILEVIANDNTLLVSFKPQGGRIQIPIITKLKP